MLIALILAASFAVLAFVSCVAAEEVSTRRHYRRHQDAIHAIHDIRRFL